MKTVYEAEVQHETEKERGHKGLVRRPEEYSEVIRTTARSESKLSAFLVKPTDMKFETQDKSEKILLLLRKHAITNVGWVTMVVVLLLLPMLVGLFPVLPQVPMGYVLLGVLSWYLVVFGFGLEKFLTWYFNVYIVTDERIIDYDFFSLMYKRVSEAKIDRIEDVTYSMGGALMSVFDYGDVYIQTAGEQREFDFVSVPKPQLVVKLLNELTIEEEREKLEGRVR